MAKRTDCRHCGEPILYEKIEDHPYFPFCSKRCKTIDLGMWLLEEHRIDEPALDVDGAEVPHDRQQ